MPIPAFPRMNYKDSDLNSVQESLRRTLDPLVQVPILDGNLLSTITVNGFSATTLVPHKLGRAFRGYIITAVRTAGTTELPALTTTSYDQTKFLGLTMNSFGSFTFDIWVF